MKLGLPSVSWETLAIGTMEAGLILLNPVDPGPHIALPHDEIAGAALIFLGATGYAMLQLFPEEGRFHDYSHLGGESDLAVMGEDIPAQAIGATSVILFEEMIDDAFPYLG